MYSVCVYIYICIYIYIYTYIHTYDKGVPTTKDVRWGHD